MAKSESLLSQAEKAKLLRAFSFQIHRKRPLAEVVEEHVELELQKGRRREYRPVAEVMNAEGPGAAMKAMGLVNAEAAVILGILADQGKDHRLLSDVLEALAGLCEQD